MEEHGAPHLLCSPHPDRGSTDAMKEAQIMNSGIRIKFTRGLTARATMISSIAMVLCCGTADAREGYPAEAPAIAIEHVTVLPMTKGGDPLVDMTVLIRAGRIASIEPSKQAGKIRDARRIDGRKKWLIPGLTDMHVHFEQEGYRRLPAPSAQSPRGPGRRNLDTPYLHPNDVFTPFIANGVLQVLELQAMSESVGVRIEVESGRVLGPHIWLAAMVDGSPPSWPYGSTRVATTPEQGRQVVRDIAAEGYDFIKPYSRLNLDTFTAIADEARKHNLRLVGHIPERDKGITDKFFQPGFDLVAHAEEFAQQTTPPALDRIPEYVDLMKRHGASIIATLTVDERILEQISAPESTAKRADIRYLSPARYDQILNHNPYVARSNPRFVRYISDIVAFNSQLIPAFLQAGIPIFAGTDSGIPGIVPGFALHDELESLTRAGMSNRQALESATRLPSEWLGIAHERGTVEAGKSADLVLLDANPMDDIRNTRRIAGVILRGHYYPRKALDRRLDEMEQRYVTMRQDMAKSKTAAAKGNAGSTGTH
jgi:imidazolonepropionase-like amidohydrolase